jgi:amino acid permease
MTYGIIPSIILTCVSGLFAVVGLILYVLCADENGRNTTLSELASIYMPYSKFLVDFSVFLKCFGVSLSYLIITRQLLPVVIKTVFGNTILDNPKTLLIVFLAFTGPFCYFQKLDKLKYTSFCGVVAIFFVVLATVYRYAKTEVPNNIIVLYFTTPNINYLSGFGKFVFSFTCHQNIFAIHSEMDDNSVPRMKKLIYFVAFSALILYIPFGLINYLLYGQMIKDNIIQNYPNDVLATIVRFLYVIVMGVSYPLQVNPSRTYLIKMIGIKFKEQEAKILSFIVTTLIILMTYGIAISGMDLGLVYTIIGATASSFMCLIFPSLFYFHMDTPKPTSLVVLSYLSFLFGVFVFSATIYSVVYHKL